MAGLNLLRRGLPRLGNGSSTRFLLPQLTTDNQQQRRTIVNKALFKLPEGYPAPWPYKEKNYTLIHAHYDRTKPRLHQNSKLIVVEGNIGAGKSTMAKELADLLGFHYMPEFKMDDILIDRYGNDLRKYYHLFPESFRIPDVNMFYQNPFADQVAQMQNRTYESRWDQYLNALAHIFNTGQGVVLERSVYSDFVFVNAMRSKDYISAEYFKYYYYKRKRSLKHVRYWPHLVIYLDVPAAKCLENIRKRGNVNEINVVDEPYLKVIEESYKDSLKEYQPHSKILAYDWSTPGDTDTIIEDIERIDFDFFEWHSGDVFEEWFNPTDEVSTSGWRMYVTDKRDAHLAAFEGYEGAHEVSELYMNPRDGDHFVNVMKNEVLKSRLGYGYLKHFGDERKGFWISGDSTNLPEPWFDYYWREEYYYQIDTVSDRLDPLGHGYDPDYLHHH
ncbi:CRE-NUO-4 protein [Aphelenchoides avenae]|nr:CRE-NUO-4 protein [Aphelenchus avenae]